MKRTLLLLSMACTMLFACKHLEAVKENATGSVNLDAVKASIAAGNKAFSEAWAKGDSNAIAACYTADACLLPANNNKICGTQALASFMGQGYRMGFKSIQLSITEVLGSGDYVSEVGTYELKDDAQKSMDKGKYMVLWKRDNGTWKMYRDIFNSDMPMMMPAK